MSPLLCLLLGATVMPLLPCQQDPAPAPLLARVDPRVELLSIVFRLAGNPEYGRGKVESYSKAVDDWFGKLQDHAVIAHAARLRRTRGVSYDAVMGLAVHLDAALQPLVPFDEAERLDARWPRADLPQFVTELRDFAAASRFDEFCTAQRPLYEVAAKRMQAVLDDKAKLAWFDAFFGSRPKAQFELCLGMLNGGGCYGPSAQLADGKEQLYCILGVWATDADGEPRFDDSVVGTVVHEFCHSYCNPLVAAHLAELRESGDSLWPWVADEMRQQAYGNAHTMLCESLVRACVVRYQIANGGEAAGRREIAEQVGRSFLWTGELAAALGDYERDRRQFATLDAFMPRVASCLRDSAERLRVEMARLPQVVRMTPANGASDVDPTVEAIVVTFDRPMRDGAWSVVGGGEHLPKLGQPAYDAECKVLTIPVTLRAGWSYEFWLNRGKFDSFASQDGHRLRPLHVTFATRK